jgi:acetyl esterase
LAKSPVRAENQDMRKERLESQAVVSRNVPDISSSVMNQLKDQPAKASVWPQLDPTVRRFLAGLKGQPDVSEGSVEEAREALAKVQGGRIARLAVDIEDRTVLVGPRGNTAVRIVRPRGVTALLPVVLYFHGGGWVTGDKETHDRLVREIAVGAQAAVVFVEYSRAPEARWPVAIEEAYAVTKWIFETGKLINVDPLRIAVMGDSAGGNIATAVTLLAKERGGPQIRLQVLLYPVTIAKFDTKSYDDFAEGYLLTREAMKWFWNHYAQNTATRDKPLASPLRASLEELSSLPPAVVITAECDVLRDEGEAYAERLKEAGVPVSITRYAGTIHDFVMLNDLASTTAAREAIEQSNEALRRAFSRERNI